MYGLRLSLIWIKLNPQTGAGQPNLLRTRELCPWDSPGKNTGRGCHALVRHDWSNLTQIHKENLPSEGEFGWCRIPASAYLKQNLDHMADPWPSSGRSKDAVPLVWDRNWWPAHRITSSFFFFLIRNCDYIVAKSCLTLCDPMDYSLPRSPVHGILQARILEWLPFPSLNCEWNLTFPSKYKSYLWN